VGQRALRRFYHQRRRAEVRLADFHVDDAPPGRFERVRAGQHVHDDEGLDLGGAPGGFQGDGRRRERLYGYNFYPISGADFWTRN